MFGGRQTGNRCAGQSVQALNGRVADHEAPSRACGHSHFQTQFREGSHRGLKGQRGRDCPQRALPVKPAGNGVTGKADDTPVVFFYLCDEGIIDCIDLASQLFDTAALAELLGERFRQRR